MANRNSVPNRVSMPVPGLDEARSAWAAQYAKEEERRRVIEGERWAYRRSQLNDRSAQARLMSDLNPLVVAGEMYAGEMLSAGLGAVGRAVFSGKMRPGYVRAPSSFHGAFDPAGVGKASTVRAYETAAETMRNIYKSPDARRILRTAIETGDRSNPLVKLYDKTKAELSRYRGMLDAQATRAESKKLRSEIREALSGFKTDAELGSDLAKSLRSSGPKASTEVAPVGGNRLWNAIKRVPGVLWRNKGKAGLAAGMGMAGVASYRMSARDGKLAEGTEEVTDQKAAFDGEYSRFTGDEALRTAMSDKNALRACLAGMRNIALREIRWSSDRRGQAAARLQEYVDGVKDSPSFADLVSENETGYAARALNPADYQREFREAYRDPASQAFGGDFWEGIGGVK